MAHATVRLEIEGMHCGMCVKSVEGALQRLTPAGCVLSFAVEVGSAEVVYLSEETSEAAIVDGAPRGPGAPKSASCKPAMVGCIRRQLLTQCLRSHRGGVLRVRRARRP